MAFPVHSMLRTYFHVTRSVYQHRVGKSHLQIKWQEGTNQPPNYFFTDSEPPVGLLNRMERKHPEIADRGLPLIDLSPVAPL